MRFGFVLALLLVLCVNLGDAKYVEGDFQEDNDQWEFLTKFCFDTDGGTVTLELVPDAPTHYNELLLFYHDLEDGWESIYDSGNSCEYKVSKAAKVINVTEWWKENGVNENVLTVGGRRPRWWYLVLANCEQESISLKEYKITLVNDGGDYKEHFGVDEQGILESLIFYFLMNFIMFIVAVVSFVKARQDTNTRTEQVMLLLMAIVGMEFFVIMLRLAHYGSYMDDGEGYPGLDDVSYVFAIFPQLIMLTIFVSVAKGWQIGSSEIPNKRGLVEILSLYFVASVALIWWYFAERNPASNLYLYQSESGALLCFLRLGLCLWFINNIRRTYDAEEDSTKRTFYEGFAALGLLWFLSLPITVITAYLADTWTRKKLVEIMSLTINFVIYVAFWVLFRPSASYLLSALHDRIRQSTDQLDHMKNAQVNDHAPLEDDEEDDQPQEMEMVEVELPADDRQYENVDDDDNNDLEHALSGGE